MLADMFIPGLLGWRHQYDRMVRGAAKLSGPYTSAIEYQDDLQHFFQDCWHLKDWIQNDRSRRKEPGFESEVQGHRALRVVQELAIACKHGNHDKTDTLGAYVVGNDVTVQLSQGAAIEVVFRIRLRDGTELAAADLVRDAMYAWNDLLGRIGLL